MPAALRGVHLVGGRTQSMAIEIVSPAQIERMRRAGQVAAETLTFVGAQLRPGMSTPRVWNDVVVVDRARGTGERSVHDLLRYLGFEAIERVR